MKKHNIIKVVLLTILLFVLLTWILPAASFSSEFYDQGRIQMGLFDLFNYPITALSYFGYIGLYIIIIGGFYGILYKIPAYRTLLDKISTAFAKRSKVAIPVIMLLLAVMVSICGLQLGLLVFFPFIASIILLMGYDKIVVALTLVGSTTIGIAGTTYAYNNVSILNSLLGTELDNSMGVKVLILVVGLALLIFNTLMYMKKVNVVKKDTKVVEEKTNKVESITIDEKEVEDEIVEEKVEVKKTTSTAKKSTSSSKSSSKKTNGKKSNKKKSSKSSKNNKAAVTDDEVIVVKKSEDNDDYLVPNGDSKKHTVLPVACSLIALFIILVLAFIPWNHAFSILAMEDATNSVMDFQLFGFPIFAKLLGTFNTFGDWMISDMIVVMAVIILVLSLIYKLKVDDVFDGFIAGAKKAVAPALVAVLVYTVLVVVTYHPFQLTIYKAILTLTKGFNVFTATIVAILSSIFNADPAYAFQAVVPYLTSLVTDSEVYPIIEVLFQSVYGFTMLFAPTSLVLMATLAYLGVSYKEWLKAIWKLLVELLVLLLILFTVLVMM